MQYLTRPTAAQHKKTCDKRAEAVEEELHAVSARIDKKVEELEHKARGNATATAIAIGLLAGGGRSAVDDAITRMRENRKR